MKTDSAELAWHASLRALHAEELGYTSAMSSWCARPCTHAYTLGLTSTGPSVFLLSRSTNCARTFSSVQITPGFHVNKPQVYCSKRERDYPAVKLLEYINCVCNIPVINYHSNNLIHAFDQLYSLEHIPPQIRTVHAAVPDKTSEAGAHGLWTTGL